EESSAEEDSFSEDSEADFFTNQRRKQKRLIVSSEDEDTEDIDVLAGGDGAGCSRVTTDNERTIGDEDTWYDNKENLIEFAFDDDVQIPMERIYLKPCVLIQEIPQNVVSLKQMKKNC
ncbi:hypothetical protein KM043_018871, partial [Ampulex compressa]